jgi:hypothetical protein
MGATIHAHGLILIPAKPPVSLNRGQCKDLSRNSITLLSCYFLSCKQ